jgi:tRNA(Arg) A34 adenosine deaminase TadA
LGAGANFTNSVGWRPARRRRNMARTARRSPLTPEQDIQFLRRSFDVARRSREGGDHPFGAVLVGPDGQVLREQGNGYSAEGGDRTAHAERLLASWAAKTLDLGLLRRSTLYTSAEPCAMCAGALYWAGVGRVVYGQSEKGLKAATGAHDENPTLDLPCRIVFAAGQRPTEVVGPLLEEEAAQLQADYWASRAHSQ